MRSRPAVQSLVHVRDRLPEVCLEFQREQGGFLGAITINYLVAIGGWIVLLVAWLIVDLPDVQAEALTAVSFALVVFLLLFFYPFSKTIWAAVEFLVYRSQHRR